MKGNFQENERPRDVVLGWRELAAVLGRTEDGVRNAPPPWLAALPVWRVAGVRCWAAEDIVAAITALR